MQAEAGAYLPFRRGDAREFLSDAPGAAVDEPATHEEMLVAESTTKAEQEATPPSIALPTIVWGKAGAGQWQKVGEPCDVCGPDGCDHTHMPTGLEQSLAEMEFARSACAAATNGDVEKLRKSLERNPGAVFHDGAGGGSGYTPLHYAARGGHLECVTLLLQAKAPVVARTSGGATPLMRAAFAGHAAVCAMLLRARAPLDAQDSDGDSALHKAAAQRHERLVATLLAEAGGAAAGALRDRKGRTAAERLAEELAKGGG